MTGFLVQYWGGPGTYSEQRGHPRLRMRHAPFAIGRCRARRLVRAHGRGGALAAACRPRSRREVLAYFDIGRRRIWSTLR